MNRGELRGVLRAEYLDDVAEPYLWAEAALDRLINEAASEAAIRSRILADTIDVQLVAGQGEYPLPAGTLDVTRVKVPSLSPLLRTSVANLDESGDWSARQGRPISYAFTAKDFGGDGVLLIYPMPAAGATARLAIRRVPVALADDNDSPELPEHLHAQLLDWAAFRAFSTRDSDQNDEARAAKHEARFEAHFGPRLSASVLQGRAEKRRHRTQINSDWR